MGTDDRPLILEGVFGVKLFGRITGYSQVNCRYRIIKGRPSE